MPKALVHAQDSVRKHRGSIEDYMPIHELMDSSKTALSDNRHRFLTHHHWFIVNVVERIFGSYIINSDGLKVSVRSIGEEHCLMDYGGKFIPTAQDFLTNIEYSDWMDNGKSGAPPSAEKIVKYRTHRIRKIIDKYEESNKAKTGQEV